MGELEPTSLMAATVHVYSVLALSPVTASEVVIEGATKNGEVPGCEHATVYETLCDPNVSAGTPHTSDREEEDAVSSRGSCGGDGAADTGNVVTTEGHKHRGPLSAELDAT